MFDNGFKFIRIMAILLIPACLAAPVQASGTFQLTGIQVVGSKSYVSSEIARATGLRLLQSITLDSLKETAGKLGGLGLFAQVSYRYRTQGEALTVEFTVQDAAELLRCTFENFVWFTPQELTDRLQSQLPLFKGYAPPGGTMLDLIASQLIALLAERGIQAQVQYSPQQVLGGPIQAMQFREIGVPIPVRRVNFTGVAMLDTALLQKAARPLLDRDYDASFIRSFSGKGIVSVYRQLGYMHAQFGEPSASLITGDPIPNAVGVTIPVSEGEQYRLKEITWSGDTVIPYSELTKSMHAAVGSPLNALQLEQDVLGLSLLYHPKGYLMAAAKSTTSLDDYTHLAVCLIQIQQGDLFRLGKLEIAGLGEPLAVSLAGQSHLRSGDPYDFTYWNRFMQEIARQLPASASGWKLTPSQTIHPDTKTVDVRLDFAPRASH